MLDTVISFLNGIISTILSILPQSPFQGILSWFSDLPYLGYLNWFFPIGGCIKVGTIWLTSIGIFYLYSVIMRWVKLIS